MHHSIEEEQKKGSNSMRTLKTQRTTYHIVIMWNLNGHFGQDRRGLEHVLRARSIEDKNPAGEHLLDFCVMNHLSIMNSFYKQRVSHKCTWYRWNNTQQNYTEKSMIDLIQLTSVLLNRNMARNILVK